MTKADVLMSFLHTGQIFNMGRHLPLELIHHFKHMELADSMNLIYMPSPKGHVCDGFYIKSEKIIETLEYKMRQNEYFFGPQKLLDLRQEFGIEKSIDKVDLGFLISSSAEKQKKFIGTRGFNTSENGF